MLIEQKVEIKWFCCQFFFLLLTFSWNTSCVIFISWLGTKEVTLRQRKPGRGHGLLPRSEEALLTCEHWDFYPGITCTINTTQVHVQERDVYGRHSFLNERCRRWKFLWVRFCQLWIHETWWKVWIKQPSLLKHHLAFCWFYDLISP